MTVLTNLADRKHQVVQQLKRADLDEQERGDLEKLLTKIETAVSLLEPAPKRTEGKASSG
jgi:hypothetical protein